MTTHLGHVVLHGFDHGAVLQLRRAAKHLHAARRRHKCVRDVAVAANLVAARRGDPHQWCQSESRQQQF